jgi:hypothetical protein
MATTTPNFGWPVPTSTDLVKDGATAIEALGDSIDASLLDLKGGTTGQVLAKASGTDMDFSWVAQDDSNAIQNSIVDAKGDLIAATANDTPARLAVGANDLLLTAASGEATGLKYTGGYTTWTPTWTNLTVGNGTQTARYSQIGKTLRFDLKLVFGSTTSITGLPIFTLPKTVAQKTADVNFHFEDVGAGNYVSTAYLNATAGDTALQVINTSGTYPILASVSATVPFTWTTTDVITVSATYEVA